MSLSPFLISFVSSPGMHREQGDMLTLARRKPIRMPRIRNSSHAPVPRASREARNQHRLDWMFHELDDF